MLTKKSKLAQSLLKVKIFVKVFLIDTWQMQLWTNIFQLGFGMLFFIITHVKVLLRFFDKKSGTSKKIRKLNPAHEIAEKFGKSWVLLICLSLLSHIIDWSHCSTPIYVWMVAKQYFNYLLKSDQIFLPLKSW